MNQERKSDFERITDPTGLNFVMEFLAFLGHSKKWWLLPLSLVLLLFGVVMFLSTTAATPFIYTLF
jgi:hypothetical protein